MSNVKPGDFAAFIKGHDSEGQTCWVEEPATQADHGILRLGRDYRPSFVFWRVRLMGAGRLQTLKNGEWRYSTATPGMQVLAADKFLRRIDPPAEPEPEQIETTLEVSA